MHMHMRMHMHLRMHMHTRVSSAGLFYVPTYLAQRITWGGAVDAPLTRLLDYVRHAHPWWNASGGRNHVWFIFGERMTCDVPAPILSRSITLGHWGGSKDFVHRGVRRHTDSCTPLHTLTPPCIPS